MVKHSIALLFVTMIVCRTASAQELAAGWEGDDRRGYAFTSPSVSIGLGASQALVFRASGSYLYYQYPVDEGRVTVTSPGVGGGIGYRVQSRHINVTFVTGLEVRNTLRVEPGARLTTLERGAYAATEVFVSAGATRISTIANYGQANRYTWARASMTRQLTNKLFEKPRAISVGVDVTLAGNRDLKTEQLGGVLVWDWFRAKASVQMRAGYSLSSSAGAIVDRHPYVGAGFYRHF